MIEYCSLSTLVEKPISGEWGEGEGPVQVIRTANFTNHGRINFSSLVGREIPEKKVHAKKLAVDDIIIEKSGGSPAQPVGRVVFFERKGTYLCNNFTSILRPLKQKVFPKYLHYILFCNHKFGFVRKYQNKTTGIINLQLAKYLKGTVIPLPPLAEQRKIAAILDAADKLKRKNQQLIDKYNALSQSLFLDMFGDPVTNSMGWDESNLQKFFSVPPRIGTTTPASKGGEIKVVRVGELGNKKVNFPKCKNVSLPTKEQERYLLDSGDIILARAIGSEHHLGKASLFEHIGCPVVFDSHVMRLRFNKDLISPLFFYHWLSSNGGRATFLKNSGQTAVQFNINAKQISRIKIKVPPIALQNKFAERIQAIEAQKQLAQAALQKSEGLFNSLLQRAFKGELTA